MYIKADIDELKKAKQELEKIKENCIKKYNKILELNNKLFCSWNGVDFIEYMNSFKNGNIGKVNKEVNKELQRSIRCLLHCYVIRIMYFHLITVK